MVEAAEHHEIVEVGGSAVGPVFDVVAFAVGGWCAAAGEGAAVVAGNQGAALFLRHGPAGSPQIQGDAVVHDDGGEVTVAGDPAGGRDRQWTGVEHACDVFVAEQVRIAVWIHPLVSRLAAGEIGGVHV
ncbi:hypothetical protein RE0356_47010 [Prescottella equi]|nr:hypothetical protein RE0356_47010 [Prescottella equi]